MIDLSALVAVLTTLIVAGFSQDIRARSGFEMAAPEGWHRITSEGIVENLGQVSMSPADMRKLLANSAASTVVVAYTKYQPAAHAGLIPKIQVSLRRNPAKTFDTFFKAISQSTAELKTYFPDFELTDPAREVPVGGRRAVRFGGTYSLETRSARRLQVRTRTYAVMHGEAFFQINFIDGADDDCSAVFDALLGTIRFEQ
jgi:hypothetical protein